MYGSECHQNFVILSIPADFHLCDLFRAFSTSPVAISAHCCSSICALLCFMMFLTSNIFSLVSWYFLNVFQNFFPLTLTPHCS